MQINQYSTPKAKTLYLMGDEYQICLFGVCLFMMIVFSPTNSNFKIPLVSSISLKFGSSLLSYVS